MEEEQYDGIWLETAAVVLLRIGSDCSGVSLSDVVLPAAGWSRRLGDGEEKAGVTSLMSQALQQTKRIGERVRNKTGRVDVLASLLTDELVRLAGSPVLSAVHKTVAPTLIDPLLHYYLGPRNKTIRQVTRVVRTVQGEMKKQRLAAGRDAYRAEQKARRARS